MDWFQNFIFLDQNWSKILRVNHVNRTSTIFVTMMKLNYRFRLLRQSFELAKKLALWLAGIFQIKIWLAGSRHHLKNSTKLTQSAPRTRFPRTEDRRLSKAQTDDHTHLDTVGHQSLLDRHFSSPELITQGYFHQMILGRDLVESGLKYSW